MCLLEDETRDIRSAIAQANLSLKELRPFVEERGSVLTGKKMEKKRLEEPHSTYAEAKTLQSKAFFRLGSAQLMMEDYEEAVKSFEQCITCTQTIDVNPEQVVLRRLNEAKQGDRRKKERQRKKFKFMFAPENVSDEQG